MNKNGIHIHAIMKFSVFENKPTIPGVEYFIALTLQHVLHLLVRFAG